MPISRGDLMLPHLLLGIASIIVATTTWSGYCRYMFTHTITLITTNTPRCGNGETIRIHGDRDMVSGQLRAIEARPDFVKWSTQSKTGGRGGWG